MLRSLIELFSRNVILKRRLPKQFGHLTIYVSPDAGLRYWKLNMYHRHNAEIYQIVNDCIEIGDSIWDIGGSVGIFSFPAIFKSGTNGSCLIIEADSFMQRVLQKTINSNPSLNVTLLPIAVSDKIGFAELNISKVSRSMNFLNFSTGSNFSGGIRSAITVPTFNLDTLLDTFSPPNFLKIDVEGAEVSVLRGSTRILNEIRPLILIEVFDNISHDIQSILNFFDYKYIDARNYNTISSTTEDYLCIPNEKYNLFLAKLGR